MAKQQLSDECIQNLIDSLMVPKLIEILVLGKEVVVERSLQLLLLLLEMNSSIALLAHILNSGLVDVVTQRADVLRWKTVRVYSSDLKVDRRQRLSENSFSSEAKVLFRLFARAVYRLVAIDMDDSLRMSLMTRMKPLLSRLLVCPDPKVIPSVVDTLRMFAERKNPIICSQIVESFAQILFSINEKTEDQIVFASLRLFSALMANCPQLFSYENFGSNLICYLYKMFVQKRNEPKFDSEMIAIISCIGQWIVINEEAIRQLSDRLINLSLIIFNCGDRSNRMTAIETIETILIKYPFQSFLNLMNIFDIRSLIIQLMVSDDRQQHISLNICSHIMNILSECFDNMPEEVEKVKQLLFSRSSDVYFCLEKLSFKTCNDFVTIRAHQLLEQIDGKLNNDEDMALLPQINQNGFVFGPTF